jgi:hypothetical protein
MDWQDAYLIVGFYFLIVAIVRRYRKQADNAGAERYFIIFLLYLLLSYHVKAQPTRPWVLTSDSNVVAPYIDIRNAAIYRLEADSLVDSYFAEGRELEQAKEGLKMALGACMSSSLDKDERIALYDHDLTICQADRDKAEVQAKRRGNWIKYLLAGLAVSVTLNTVR